MNAAKAIGGNRQVVCICGSSWYGCFTCLSTAPAFCSVVVGFNLGDILCKFLAFIICSLSFSFAFLWNSCQVQTFTLSTLSFAVCWLRRLSSNFLLLFVSFALLVALCLSIQALADCWYVYCADNPLIHCLCFYLFIHFVDLLEAVVIITIGRRTLLLYQLLLICTLGSCYFLLLITTLVS